MREGRAMEMSLAPQPVGRPGFTGIPERYSGVPTPLPAWQGSGSGNQGPPPVPDPIVLLALSALEQAVRGAIRRRAESSIWCGSEAIDGDVLRACSGALIEGRVPRWDFDVAREQADRLWIGSMLKEYDRRAGSP
jgi:hypothetical protein